MPSDNFDRISDNSLGSNWHEVEEPQTNGAFQMTLINGINGLRIHAAVNKNDANPGAGQDPSRGFAYWDGNGAFVWSDDQSSKAKLVAVAQGPSVVGQACASLGVRIQPCGGGSFITTQWQLASGYGLVIDLIDAASGIKVIKVVDLVETSLGTSPASNVKLLDTLELKAVGTTISLLRTKGANWPGGEQGQVDTLISVVDATFQNGRAGWLQNRDRSSVPGYNPPFQAYNDWDDWVGTNLNTTFTGGVCGSGSAVDVSSGRVATWCRN